MNRYVRDISTVEEKKIGYRTLINDINKKYITFSDEGYCQCSKRRYSSSFGLYIIYENELLIDIPEWYSNIRKDTQGGIECIICFENHKHYIMTPCGHNFGQICLLQCRAYGNLRCPTCRSDI